MPRPNFWRLKRKSNDSIQTSVQNPPKISQKTISSFFGVSGVTVNLNAAQDTEEFLNDDTSSSNCLKRAKMQGDVSDVVKEKKVKLSESALDKLKTFSASINESTKHFSDRNFPIDAHCSSSASVENALCDSQGCDSKEENGDEETVTSRTLNSKKMYSSNKINQYSHSRLDLFRAKNQQSSVQKILLGPSKVVGKVKYTPLEQQVIDLWKQHPGILLFVECGYKYRFFGEDAEIAAKELNIYAHLDHNFMTASIPVHRLHAHISRLVEKGYKVGVVKQTETAALKAISENKNAPFSRKLEQIYTRATLIGEDLELVDQNVNFDDGPSHGHILCLNEIPSEQSLMSIGFVSVSPSTGECLYDSFEDNVTREELYKRLQIVNPTEILIPTVISENTEKLLSHVDARLERLSDQLFDPTNAMTKVVSHFAKEMGEKCDSHVLERLTEIPSITLTCLAALQSHLSEFGLEKAIRPNGLQCLTSGMNFLKLDASTIRNLQFFKSDSGSVQGSLFWALNHTKTRFGARLLHRWLAEPIRDLELLEDRQEAISELLSADKVLLSSLLAMLTNLPDLDKGLTTILHKKCNPMQFLCILDALCRACTELSSFSECIENSFKVPLLRKLVSNTAGFLSNVQTYRDNINVQAAKDGDKTQLLKDFSAFPTVLKLKNEIHVVTSSLDKLRKDIARTLSLLSVSYVTVSGQEYLIEVTKNNAKCVPSNWRKISSTKQVGRYRPPAVDTLFNELQRLQDKLRAECHLAWLGFLQDFGSHYYNHKQAVCNIATLDVLMSLAHVAQQEGFCRPKLIKSENARIIIKQGRHPVVPLLFGSANQFVPNDTNLDSSTERCMVLSGPNMGGKSCYIRQVALIAVLAHLGSYVPAEFAEISLLESIHTRMGARDELFHGRSTLMVELEETAGILQRVSRHSLVLLDELGRGTGSCDGSAIACATLRHIVLEVQCLTLFVTHYPPVMSMVSDFGGKAMNYHMAFLLHNEDGEEFLTFLYEVVKGAADRSYGINVARLANLNKQLLHTAHAIAFDLESKAVKTRNLRETFLRLWRQ